MMKKSIMSFVLALAVALLFVSIKSIVSNAWSSENGTDVVRMNGSKDVAPIQNAVGYGDLPPGDHSSGSQACFTIDTSRPEWLGLYPPFNLQAAGGLDGYVPLAWEAPTELGKPVPSAEMVSQAKGIGIFNGKAENPARIMYASEEIAGFLGYNIYRGQTQGGPYPTAVTTGLQTTTYDDSTVTNGVRYYYVVTAVYDAGESAYSNEVSATPAAQCVGGDRGDANGDGNINVLDALAAVNHILGIQPLDENGQCRADCNVDGQINILDVLGVVNVILGLGTCPPTLMAKSLFTPASISALFTVGDGEGAVRFRISVDSEIDIAGVQLRLAYNPVVLTPGVPRTSATWTGMNVASNADSGELRIVVYSSEGKTAPSGNRPFLTVPFTAKGPVRGANLAPVFEEAILAASCSELIPVEIAPIVIKGLPLPTDFALEQNYPNPFNPTTAIGYQLSAVSSPVRTTLKIYNILGQEVRTLVDEVKEPGYYTVAWDGRNESGDEVSSGVYFYRLTAGDFAETKRMLLLR